MSEAESASLGGDVGCLNEGYGAGAEALLKVVGELKEGDTSAVVESVLGLHVVKLRGKLTDQDREGRARAYAATKLATQAEAQNAATRFARELMDKVRGGKALEEATTELARATAEAGPLPKATEKDAAHPALASDLVPKVEISRPFSIDQGPLSTTKPDQDAGAIAFALQKDGDLAPEPIDTVSGVAVLQLKSKELADKKSFDEEKATLLEQFRSRKADDALTAYIERLRSKAGTIKFDPKHVPTDDAKSPAGPAKG